MQLLCLGDIAITSKELCKQRWEPPLAGFPTENDKILLNWEFPLGTEINPNPRRSGNRYLSHPDSPDVIRHWSPGYACMGTNHTLDAEEPGLLHTQTALRERGFDIVGAGATQNEIETPLFWETPEGRLAIINWVFPETHPDCGTVPGVNCWPGVEEAGRTIRKYKEQADWVLAVLHWSDELFPYPRPEDRVIAHSLVAAGVDVIVGHHPHVVRGMENINSVPVFYSIGNFYFSELIDPRTKRVDRAAPRCRESIGVKITFLRHKSPVCETFSFWQIQDQVILDKKQRAGRRLVSVSKPLTQIQDARYADWYHTKRTQFFKWEARWQFGVRRLGLKGLIQYALNKVFSRKKG